MSRRYPPKRSANTVCRVCDLETLRIAERREAHRDFTADHQTQAIADDPVAMFQQMTDVQGVMAIEKRDALSGKFDPPDGAWSLLIQPRHQKWNWLAGPSMFQEIIRKIAKTGPGRWLRTGYQKASGALYVELYEAGRRTLFFSSDGAAWDEPEGDEDELDGFLESDSNDYYAS